MGYIQSGFSEENEKIILDTLSRIDETQSRIDTTQKREVKVRQYALYAAIAGSVLAFLKLGIISFDVFKRWRS